jgi:hypothetical protein
MTIAVSGQKEIFAHGKIRVSVKGGTSVFEINQDNIGWNNISGDGVVDGVIPDGKVTQIEVGSRDTSDTKYRFTDGTGTPVVSFVWLATTD